MLNAVLALLSLSPLILRLGIDEITRKGKQTNKQINKHLMHVKTNGDARKGLINMATSSSFRNICQREEKKRKILGDPLSSKAAILMENETKST